MIKSETKEDFLLNVNDHLHSKNNEYNFFIALPDLAIVKKAGRTYFYDCPNLPSFFVFFFYFIF